MSTKRRCLHFSRRQKYCESAALRNSPRSGKRYANKFSITTETVVLIGGKNKMYKITVHNNVQQNNTAFYGVEHPMVWHCRRNIMFTFLWPQTCLCVNVQAFDFIMCRFFQFKCLSLRFFHQMYGQKHHVTAAFALGITVLQSC